MQGNRVIEKPPRMKIIEEEKKAFLDSLEKGLPVSEALSLTTWSKSSYYYKMKSEKKADRKFQAEVNAAKSKFYQTLSTSNFKLVQSLHPETVKHNIQRMDRDLKRNDYKDALVSALKKAISELDFERAERLQQQIDKAG